MTRYEVSPAAQEDIRAIVDYILVQSETNAAKAASKLYDAFEQVAEWPGIGHIRAELRDDRLRVISVFKFLIIYDRTAKPVRIMRVVHGARNLRWVRPNG